MDTEVQPNLQPENGSKIVESSSDPPGETATNGKDSPKTPPQIVITRETRSRSGTPQQRKDKKARSRSRTPQQKKEKKTRSRSQTPQTKKDKKSVEAASPLKKIDEYLNGHEEKKTRSADKKNKAAEDGGDGNNSKNGISLEEDKPSKEPKKSAKKSKELEQPSDAVPKPSNKDKEIVSAEPEVSTKDVTVSKPEGEGIDMDPLILGGDEPDPELQFDENSDMDSGKGSPIQLRCKTRRSHTRHIPTPKTPKSVTDSESEKNSIAPTPTPENLNDTNDSLNIEDISTKVEVGNDTSRLDFSASVFSDDSYLNYSRERSLSETLRGLSSRRSIRPLNDSYRQKAFRNTQNRSDLNLPYSKHESDDRVVGMKRKRSTTPEERKRHKSESTGFVSYLSSPLGNFKSRFISDVNTGTPTLTSYRDGSKNIHEELMYSEVVSEEPEKKNWCSLM